MTPKDYLLRAVGIAGNANRLAEKMGGRITPSHIFNWLKRDRDGVSPVCVIQLAAAVDFQVTPHQLRPDIYPNPNDGLPIKPSKVKVRAA